MNIHEYKSLIKKENFYDYYRVNKIRIREVQRLYREKQKFNKLKHDRIKKLNIINKILDKVLKLEIKRERLRQYSKEYYKNNKKYYKDRYESVKRGRKETD